MLIGFALSLLIGVLIGMGINRLMGANDPDENGPDEEAPDTEGMGLLTFVDTVGGDR